MSMNNELSEYELLRLKNIEENYQKMKELGILNPQYSECKPLEATPTKPLRIKRTRKSNGLSSMWPVKRRSTRLSSLSFSSIKFTEDVANVILGNEDTCLVSLDDVHEGKHDNSDCPIDDFIVDDERPKCRNTPRRRHSSSERVVPSVDEITEEDLKRVVENSGDKVYSQDGTTCHQCRQKTLDQKTICRSKKCFGVRGQFCGPCLKNRYGELVVKVLKDPDWVCPPCRGVCNCSICRNQAGKLPTGQLFHLAQEKGYQSVRHFLEKEDED